ncbi:MAG: serine hydrolase domain-containing protein [Saprospiraceae bacterium]
MTRLLISSFLLLILGALQSQSLTPIQEKAIHTLVTDNVKKGSPGLAIGIVQQGKIIYEHYAGLANLAHEVPIDELTRFNIASNGKQFTALCILQLANTGKLNLADDIRTYLPDLYPTLTAPITIRHLLQHSSGIRDVYDLWALQGITWWKHTFDNDDALALLIKQQELNFAPGTEHLYSNSNYILLAQIIKVVTGTDFIDYANTLFDKLGMPHTSFVSSHMQVVPHKASPYANWQGWMEYPYLSDTHGDGALFTTLQDQLRWETMVQTKISKVFSAETIETSQKAIANTAISDYGFGLTFGQYRGLEYHYHEGSTGAWKASFLRFPTENLAIVVMSNSGSINPFDLSRRCADILISKDKLAKDRYPRRPDTLGPYIAPTALLGTYRTKGGYFFRFVKQAEGLYMERYGRESIQLEHEAGNLYHQVSDPDWKQAFTKDPIKGLQVTGFYPSHDPYTLTRIEVNWQDYNYTSINGDYLNEETGVRLTIEFQQDDKYVILLNGEKLEGQLYAPDFLLVDGYKIQIVRDEDGIVPRLLVNSNRIQHLHFERITNNN